MLGGIFLYSYMLSAHWISHSTTYHTLSSHYCQLLILALLANFASQAKSVGFFFFYNIPFNSNTFVLFFSYFLHLANKACAIFIFCQIQRCFMIIKSECSFLWTGIYFLRLVIKLYNSILLPEDLLAKSRWQ